MKSIVYTHCLTALALGVAVAFTSCNKVESELPVDDGTITIEFQQVDAENATRTEFHEKTIWWSKDDKVRFFQYASVKGAMKCVSSSYTLKSARESLPSVSASFNTPDEGTDSYYFSVFPFDSYKSYSVSSGHVLARINTPDTQKPTATGFDPAADLLISNYAENLTKTDGKYVVLLSYYRQVALGKMRLINLPSTSPIASVEFSALHDESDVTLAGNTLYDFTTQGPTSVDTKKNKLTLDYSGQNITGDMTAYFCCYPFELDEDDSFTVTVVTEAGETFTREVILPASRTLSFKADRGTQFTVDMSKALKTNNWLTVEEYSSSSYYTTTNKIYFRVHTTARNVTSGKFMVVSEEVFAGISDIEEYLDANEASSLSDNSISNINSNGQSANLRKSSLTGDTWYVAMAKLVLEDGTVGVNYTRIRTDWFTMTVQTRANGGITYYFYGAGIAQGSQNYRTIATDGLPEGTTFEDYYTNTLAPGGLPGAIRTSINNDAGVNGVTSSIIKYYTDKTTQVDMIPGTNYTVMIKVKNGRGETKFVTASANAGGSTE